MANIETKAKVSLSTFRPKAHGQDAYKDKALKLGTIIGIANGKSVRQNVEKPDQPHIGMKGNFRCILADGTTVQAGVCYLPEAWQDQILKALEDSGDMASIQFAYHVKIEKAENAAGYSWVLETLLEASANDPLAALTSKVIPATLAIEGPSEEPGAVEAVTGKEAAPSKAK